MPGRPLSHLFLFARRRFSSRSHTFRKRSSGEIASLVERRVRERDGWKVHGVVSGAHAPIHASLATVANLHRIQNPSPEELERSPVCQIDWDLVSEPSDDETIRVTWLGHSSLLVQMNGCSFVTDPIFSERCSPSQFVGPKRFQPPPCTVKDLCERISIDAVFVSHNHYDHMDYNTLKDFAVLSPDVSFTVPLGLGDWFRRYLGVEVQAELDWHEETSFGPVVATAIPMRHWSNRIGIRDTTLWCGFVFSGLSDDNTTSNRFLFSGDTAWFDDIARIGALYGPFDAAAISIGAYEPRESMQFNHLNVEEAVQMKDAINAKFAVPIHYATFPLTIEPFLEPSQKLKELMDPRPDHDTFTPWLIGETRTFRTTK